MDNIGKKFEDKVKEDLLKIDGSSLDRLHDQVSGYKIVSRNPSDFIFYHYPNQYYIECKTTKGNTFSLDKLTQYELLLLKSGIKGVRAGVLIYFYDHFRVLYVPVKTFEQLKKDGKKSVNINYIFDSYKVLEIPCKKLRTFVNADYTCLLSLEEGW